MTGTEVIVKRKEASCWDWCNEREKQLLVIMHVKERRRRYSETELNAKQCDTIRCAMMRFKIVQCGWVWKEGGNGGQKLTKEVHSLRRAIQVRAGAGAGRSTGFFRPWHCVFGMEIGSRHQSNTSQSASEQKKSEMRMSSVGHFLKFKHSNIKKGFLKRKRHLLKISQNYFPYQLPREKSPWPGPLVPLS